MQKDSCQQNAPTPTHVSEKEDLYGTDFFDIEALKQRVEGYDIMNVATLIDVAQQKLQANAQKLLHLSIDHHSQPQDLRQTNNRIMAENYQLAHDILPFLYERIEFLDE